MGYYVNNEYADLQLREAPPEKPIISQCAAALHAYVSIHACVAFALPDINTFLCVAFRVCSRPASCTMRVLLLPCLTSTPSSTLPLDSAVALPRKKRTLCCVQTVRCSAAHKRMLAAVAKLTWPSAWTTWRGRVPSCPQPEVSLGRALPCRLVRSILADKPRVTRFPVEFDASEAVSTAETALALPQAPAAAAGQTLELAEYGSMQPAAAQGYGGFALSGQALAEHEAMEMEA